MYSHNCWERGPRFIYCDPCGAFWEGWGRGQAYRRSLEVYWSLSHPFIGTPPVNYTTMAKHISHQPVHSRPPLSSTPLTLFEMDPLKACGRDASESRVYGCMERMQGWVGIMADETQCSGTALILLDLKKIADLTVTIPTVRRIPRKSQYPQRSHRDMSE